MQSLVTQKNLSDRYGPVITSILVIYCCVKGKARIGVPKFLLPWKTPCHQMLTFPLPIQSPQNQHYILFCFFFFFSAGSLHWPPQSLAHILISSPTWRAHPVCSPSSPDLFQIFPKPEGKARFWTSPGGRQNLPPPPKPWRGTKFISVHVSSVTCHVSCDMRIWELKTFGEVCAGADGVGRNINSHRAAWINCEKLICK